MRASAALVEQVVRQRAVRVRAFRRILAREVHLQVGVRVFVALGHRRRGVPPTALGALQAVVNPAHQGGGLSVQMLQSMAGLAAARGVSDLFAPIRPTHKARYPLAPFERYVAWTRPDGLPLDPWQRVHARLGATPVGIVDKWLTATGTVANWTQWTGMPLPGSGPYVVPGALDTAGDDVRPGASEFADAPVVEFSVRGRGIEEVGIRRRRRRGRGSARRRQDRRREDGTEEAPHAPVPSRGISSHAPSVVRMRGETSASRIVPPAGSDVCDVTFAWR